MAPTQLFRIIREWTKACSALSDLAVLLLLREVTEGHRLGDRILLGADGQRDFRFLKASDLLSMWAQDRTGTWGAVRKLWATAQLHCPPACCMKGCSWQKQAPLRAPLLTRTSPGD